MLRNTLNNISTKIKTFNASISNDNSINKVPSLYKNYILVKINMSYKEYKERWKENDSIKENIKKELGVEEAENEKNQILNNYWKSIECNNFVKKLYKEIAHPKVLKIVRVEGNEYVYHTINYTHSPRDIKIGEEIVKTQKIGTYVKDGKKITHYYVNATYEGRMKIKDFNKNVKPLTVSEKESLGGYENMEKAAGLISKNAIPIIDINKYITDKFVSHAVQYKAHNKLEEIPNSNKGDGGEPEL